MGNVESRLNKAAFLKASVWNTEVNVGIAGAGIIPLNWGVPKSHIPPIDEDSIASPFQTDLDYGDITPSDFPLEFDGRYDGLLKILALCMGTAGAPAIQGGGPAYLHTLQLKDSIAGLFGTYAVEKFDKIHVVPSLKVHKLTFTLAGGLIKITAACRGSQVIDDSAIVTSMSAVTYPQKHERILYKHGVFRANAQGGAALASPTDNILPKNFTLEVERGDLDAEHTASSQLIVEPLEGKKKPQVKLTMEFPRMDTANKAYFADWKVGNEKKMDLIFTGSLIATPYYYYFKFQLPRLRFEDVEYPHAGVIPAKVVMRGLEADTAPLGMTGITKPVQLDVMCKTTTDPLA
jgi:hypothetical protein